MLTFIWSQVIFQSVGNQGQHHVPSPCRTPDPGGPGGHQGRSHLRSPGNRGRQRWRSRLPATSFPSSRWMTPPPSRQRRPIPSVSCVALTARSLTRFQRAPGLMLAIKATVDADPRPGRFLLTGSANLMTLPRVADSLAGRMGIVRLLPLAQAELRGATPDFLDKTFAGKPPTFRNPIVGDSLVETVLAGGYPEALTRSNWRRRRGLASRLHRGDRPTRCPRHRPDRSTGLNARAAARSCRTFRSARQPFCPSARRSA